MSVTLSVLSALGGVAVFTGAVWALIRGLLRQSDSVRANTKATEALTDAIEHLTERVDDQGTRLAVLEDWRKTGTR